MLNAPAAAAVAPAPELAWSQGTLTEADIEALVEHGLLPENSISGWKSCTGEAFPLEDWTETGGKYHVAVFKDSNKKWAEEWFVVANPSPGLPPYTVLPPVPNAKWEEKLTEEEMVEVEVLLAEL
ncbi:hypothetical protein C2845_PM15G01440 [Panicum miliaceum]|uniref:Uncharacterized protein n=1 Tax=Panicum miliaceum TaxID=4540 RepID=A0A3L6Q5X3_PANMI|nr:hypothetical protein C2845_PM15G01440 [Panicum miliaceum]